MKTTDRLIGSPRGDRIIAVNAAARMGAKRLDDVDNLITTYYEVGPKIGIDPAIATSAFFVETGNGTNRWWRERLNAGSLGVTGDPAQNEASPTFATGHDAALAHLGHLLTYALGPTEAQRVWLAQSGTGVPLPDVDPRFAAYLDAYGNVAKAPTIAGLAGTYAADRNYANAIVGRASDVFGPTITDQGETPPMPGVQIAGLDKLIDLDVPIEIRLIPIGQTNQRTGIPMQPDRWVQHETGNTRPGADARAERAYLANGAPDQYGRSQQLSFHFAVDDLRIVQCIPVDEVAWHGGDGAGPCNYRGIACELCVGSTVNWAKARTNAEKLCAAVTEVMGIPVEAIRQHNACSGKDCPHYMRAEGYWPAFVENVRRFREGTVPPKWAKAVKPTLPVRPHIDGNGAFWLPLKQTRWTAREPVKRHQWAFEESDEVGPPITPADGPVTFVYSVASPDAGVWFVSRNGSRVRADAFVPETV